MMLQNPTIGFIGGIHENPPISNIDEPVLYSDYIYMIIGTLRAMSYAVNFADLRKIDRTQFARFVNNSDILVVSVTIDNLPFIEKMAIPPE